MRGDETKRSTKATVDGKEDVIKDAYTSACPRVYFADDQTLRVTVNSLDKITIDKTLVGKINERVSDQKAGRILSHAPSGWIAVAIVFKKSTKDNRETTITTYINGEAVGNTPSDAVDKNISLKLNNGPLHVTSDRAFKIANLSYFNYALSPKEVMKMHSNINAKDFEKEYALDKDQSDRTEGTGVVPISTMNVIGRKTNF